MKEQESGFTLLELIVVVAVIGILATIAMPNFIRVPLKANEAVLKTNLHTLRGCIDQYYADLGHYPPTLESLAESGYIRKIPRDPITKSNETWVVVYEEYDEENAPPETDQPEDAQPGVIDVFSGSERVTEDGVPYAEW